MPKRISKYYFKTYSLKSPNIFIQEIGNIARAHSASAVSYTFDFTNRFDWHAGDFGDRVSCYWGSNYNAREMLADNNARAIRFYDASGCGYGRAWIAPARDFYIVFNGYGFTGNSTLIITRVLAEYLSVSYHKINLSNNGMVSGTLWINNEAGYAVGPSQIIESVTAYDLEWEDPYTDFCENCGAALSEDSIFTGADDLTYCESCYDRLFNCCDLCGGTFWQEEITVADGEYICEYCLDRNFVSCEHCGEYMRSRHAAEKDGLYYCPNCFSELDP